MANKKLAELPTVGAGGPGNAPDSEKLLSVKPDVIFMYNTETSAIDGLQSKTGIPVVALSYGKTEVFDLELDGYECYRQKRRAVSPLPPLSVEKAPFPWC